MTIAPDVLEELDFPTPEPLRIDAALARLNTLLQEVLTIISGIPDVTESSYCWCSPSRAMALHSDFPTPSSATGG